LLRFAGRRKGAVQRQPREAVDKRPAGDGGGNGGVEGAARSPLPAHRPVEQSEGARGMPGISRFVRIEQRLAPHQIEPRRIGERESDIGHALPADALLTGCH